MIRRYSQWVTVLVALFLLVGGVFYTRYQMPARAGKMVSVKMETQSDPNVAMFFEKSDRLEPYENTYCKGFTDIFDLLTVEQETHDLKAQLDNIIYERLANRVSLGLTPGLGVDL
ncbi:MAG: hypothetical protein PVI90_13695 [Desulfobacteraceae bacterium]|jgi:hypothetical protein